jgi:chromosome segregation ATPase
MYNDSISMKLDDLIHGLCGEDYSKKAKKDEIKNESVSERTTELKQAKERVNKLEIRRQMDKYKKAIEEAESNKSKYEEKLIELYTKLEIELTYAESYRERFNYEPQDMPERISKIKKEIYENEVIIEKINRTISDCYTNMNRERIKLIKEA